MKGGHSQVPTVACWPLGRTGAHSSVSPRELVWRCRRDVLGARSLGQPGHRPPTQFPTATRRAALCPSDTGPPTRLGEEVEQGLTSGLRGLGLDHLLT